MVARICYRAPEEKEVDEAFYRQLTVASQDLILMRGFELLDICCKNTTAVQEFPDDRFLIQVLEKPTRGVPLDVVLTDKAQFVADVKVKGILACSDHKIMKLKLMKRCNRAKYEITTLGFSSANSPFS